MLNIFPKLSFSSQALHISVILKLLLHIFAFYHLKISESIKAGINFLVLHQGKWCISTSSLECELGLEQFSLNIWAKLPFTWLGHCCPKAASESCHHFLKLQQSSLKSFFSLSKAHLEDLTVQTESACAAEVAVTEAHSSWIWSLGCMPPASGVALAIT